MTASFPEDLGTTVRLINDKGEITGADSALHMYVDLPFIFRFKDQLRGLA